jgi:hypothetical protein
LIFQFCNPFSRRFLKLINPRFFTKKIGLMVKPHGFRGPDRMLGGMRNSATRAGLRAERKALPKAEGDMQNNPARMALPVFRNHRRGDWFAPAGAWQDGLAQPTAGAVGKAPPFQAPVGAKPESGQSPTLPCRIYAGCQPAAANPVPNPNSALRTFLAGAGIRPQKSNYQTNPIFLERPYDAKYFN